uniref:SFRICE_027924 n=1 Tax=Spodoptera frugiperda TaxID=7108 RepID=A0A2H1W4M2_SPOFR
MQTVAIQWLLRPLDLKGRGSMKLCYYSSRAGPFVLKHSSLTLNMCISIVKYTTLYHIPHLNKGEAYQTESLFCQQMAAQSITGRAGSERRNLRSPRPIHARNITPFIPEGVGRGPHYGTTMIILTRSCGLTSGFIASCGSKSRSRSGLFLVNKNLTLPLAMSEKRRLYSTTMTSTSYNRFLPNKWKPHITNAKKHRVQVKYGVQSSVAYSRSPGNSLDSPQLWIRHQPYSVGACFKMYVNS